MTDAGQPGPEPQQPHQPQPAQPQPGGQPQPEASSGGGLDPKIGGLLSYLLGWIGGLIMLLTQKHPEVKFHGAQSVALNIALLVFWIALTILSTIMGVIGLGFIGTIFSLLAWLVVGLGGFVLWIILCIKGYNLEHFKLPVIGDMAEKFASN